MSVMVITGASSGLGAELTRHFSKGGWRVCALARSVEKLKMLESECSGVEAYACDIANADEVESVFSSIQEKYGVPDVLVNNAAVFETKPFSETSAESISRLIDTNLKGVMYSTLQIAEGMKNRGSGDVITISSVSGIHGIPNQAIYGASKHGVNGFCDVLSQEMKEHGVRVCCLCPGGIDTPLWNEDNPYPLENRLIKPQEIIDLIDFILSHPGHTVYKRLVFFPDNEWH